jgi:hypothetical protein
VAEGGVAWWKRDKPLLALLALFVVFAPLVTQRIYASDEIQYFAYTHSLFFDGDLDFGNEYLYFYESDREKFRDIYEDLYLKREPQTDLPINVAPIGTGLLWMPSYALAHLITLGANALGADIPADGYSRIYIGAICLTSYIFGCLGLLFSYFLTRKYLGRRVSAVAVATLWLATPLLFYMVIAPPWSHATSLLAVTLFLWYWDRTRREEGRKLWEWALLGALGGVMMLVREQDALFLVVPFVEAVFGFFRGVQSSKFKVQSSADEIQGEGGWFARLRAWLPGLVVMWVTAAVVFIPQLIGYRVITGRFGPSQVVSGKFTFTSPNALNVLFSPEHGLVPWTPIVVLCLAGLVVMWGWRGERLVVTAFGVAFLLQVYIAGSFLTWQSAGSFGQRRFINCTAIFILGFAMLLAWLLEKGAPKWLLGGMAGLFVAWNLGLIAQYALWCSSQRQALDWATVLRGQVELIWKLPSLAWDYVTNREQFYRRTRC